jgi:hypothetical protein
LRVRTPERARVDELVDDTRRTVGEALVEATERRGGRWLDNKGSRLLGRGLARDGDSSRDNSAKLETNDLQALVDEGRKRTGSPQLERDGSVAAHQRRLEAREKLRRDDVPLGARTTESNKLSSAETAVSEAKAPHNVSGACDSVAVAV